MPNNSILIDHHLYANLNQKKIGLFIYKLQLNNIHQIHLDIVYSKLENETENEIEMALWPIFLKYCAYWAKNNYKHSKKYHRQHIK
jgi:hypothetical protein